MSEPTIPERPAVCVDCGQRIRHPDAAPLCPGCARIADLLLGSRETRIAQLTGRSTR